MAYRTEGSICGRPFTGRLSDQGEKSIDFYFIMVPLIILKYGTPKPSYRTLIETLLDPFKEP